MCRGVLNTVRRISCPISFKLSCAVCGLWEARFGRQGESGSRHRRPHSGAWRQRLCRWRWGWLNGKRQSEQVRRMGHKQNKKGKFAEALGLYNRAISMAPDTRCAGAARRRLSSGTSGCRRRWWSASWPLGWSVVRACAHERLTSELRKRWFSFLFCCLCTFFTVCCFWRQFHKCGASPSPLSEHLRSPLLPTSLDLLAARLSLYTVKLL